MNAAIQKENSFSWFLTNEFLLKITVVYNIILITNEIKKTTDKEIRVGGQKPWTESNK